MSDDTTTLWKTNVGSHLWGMNRPDSDVDIFEAYVVPTRSILRGYARQNSHELKGKGTDLSRHEIGKVVAMLKNGNVNFVLGALSTIIVKDSPYLSELQRIFKENPCSNIYHSVYGMAMHNYKRNFEKNNDLSWKKMAQVLRVIRFGTRYLKEGKIVFAPVTEPNIMPETIQDEMRELERTYLESKLPDTPNSEAYDDYLERIRMDELLAKLKGV